MSSKTQRWEWAISLKLEELNDQHLQSAYKLNWDSLCKFDNCRKNCKRILCLACFDKSWIDNDNTNNSGYDHYDTTNFEQKRADLKSFVGLKNLGATCYVNCLLQLWFHNPALRKAIYEWDPNSDNKLIQNNKTSSNILEQIDSTSKELDHNSKITSTKRSFDELQIANNNSIQNKKKGKTFIETDDKNQLSLVQVSKLLSPNNSNPTTSTTVATTGTKQSTSLTTTTTTTTTQQGQKSKDQVKTNPIEQLQLIFARLQFTNKKSIDPFNFIDSLALNAAEQQDAQEFGNLFMEFLEKSFANQNNRFVSKIIQNQFCGRYSYATICDICKHNSLSDSNFYELDLSIQNLETLHDCLNEFFRPVPLDGKYNCSHCEKAQSAHRKIILKSLPPTLNLQLLRFVYDVQRNVRQKLNSYIIFPEILDMNPYLRDADMRSKSNLDLSIRNNYLTNGTIKSKSNIYILSAVLIHRGSSPHSGHYIAHIKDRITKDWYKFNDDSVERIGPQLQVSTDGENISIVEDKTENLKINDANSGKITKLESKSLKSKTAYMLVYQAQDNEALSYPSDNSEKWMLPVHLQTAVAEENSRSEELFESLEIAKEVDQQIMNARKDQIRTIYEKLICRDPSDKFEFIDKNWLQRWLTNSSSTAKFPPINNSNFLCCHNKLDFRKIDQVKCVRTEGADLLYKEFGGGPRLQDAMCRDCVELEVKLIQLKDRMKEDQKYITSQAKFKLEVGYDFDDAYIVGKNSYRDWQALVMVQFKKSYPELMNRGRDSSANQQNSSDEDDQKVAKISKETSESIKRDDNDNNSNSDSDDEAIEKFVFNSDILCEHNQLIIDTTAWRIVPKEVWMIFKHYFGNDPSRPLIERNANTIMCTDCKRQEEEQQEMGDMQKMIATEQKSKLTDLFYNRKRASWCSMLPQDIYYALDREFLTKWQKFIRNPCNQARPTSVNSEKLICEHGKSLYNYTNSNPILPDCPFVLIKSEELETLKEFYQIDYEIKFTIDPDLAEKKLKEYQAVVAKSNLAKKSSIEYNNNIKQQIDPSDTNITLNNNNNNNSESNSNVPTDLSVNSASLTNETDISTNQNQTNNITQTEHGPAGDEFDLSEIDWSDCVISKPDFCSECHEMLKQDELKKLLNYETAIIYITKVENPNNVHGPKASSILSSSSSTKTTGNSNTTPTTNAINSNTNGENNITTINQDCDKETCQVFNEKSQMHLNDVNQSTTNVINNYDSDVAIIDEHPSPSPFKRRKKSYIEDEANDFVPPCTIKQTIPPASQSNSILRRTTRRNRNREQAYTIKPTQTLLQLKKEIFQRCQVLPVDQRLFLNDVLLDDNDKTMSQLRIIPNCSLKLEVDRPISDNIDMIEDEPSSRKSCAQPETGFKGSLLLSNSYHS